MMEHYERIDNPNSIRQQPLLTGGPPVEDHAIDAHFR